MSLVDWLKAEIAAMQRHILDFDAGTVIKHNGMDVTAQWKEEYALRKAGLEEILNRQNEQVQ